jgi:uncharacterized protein (TIGR02145 family)/uncharacterized repeat protein (TIGR02543 family)
MTVTMDGSKELVANFAPLTYTLTINSNPPNGGSVSSDPGKSVYTYNEQVTVTATANTNYKFTRWSGASSSTSANVAITMDENKTLTANFEQIITYTVSFSANGGNGTVSSRNAQEGNSITLPDGSSLSRSGYTFIGWNTNTAGTGINYNAGDPYTPTATITLYAKWNAVYTVSFNANNGSGTAPSAQTANAGSSVTLPDGSGLSRSGYTFGGWNTNSNGTGTNYNVSTTYTPNGSITFYAKWNIVTYAITYTLNSGTVSPANPASYTIETPAFTLTNPTRTGYRFAGWTGTNGTTPQIAVSVPRGNTGDKNYTANWTLIAYTITFYTVGGTVSPTSGTTDADRRLASLPTPTRSGYIFLGWYTGDTEVTTNTEFSANATIFARWVPIYTVTFNANGGTVSPTSGTTGADSTLASLPTPTRTGYTFNGWAFGVGGTTVTTSTVFRANATIYAQWTATRIPTPTITTFTDSRDGKTYKKVAVGDQVWMAENLNYDVPDVTSDVCNGNYDANCVRYGRLYNWATAMDINASYNSSPWNGNYVNNQGVCPVGWHLPSSYEWATLLDYVGGVSTAGTKLKSSTAWGSYSSVPAGTDAYGWSALPGGYGRSDGSYSSAGYQGYWWSATQTGGAADYAWFRRMYHDHEDANGGDNYKTNLYSVRCVED